MTDTKEKGSPANGSSASPVEQYEVEFFAKKHGLSIEEARRIIEDAGPSRENADAAAEEFKR